MMKGRVLSGYNEAPDVLTWLTWLPWPLGPDTRGGAR
jgi:hypothetical protein